MDLVQAFAKVFWFLGGILLLLGVGVGLERVIFVAGSGVTEGEVVSVQVQQNEVPMMDQGTGFHYYPTVSFVVPETAQTVTFNSPAGPTGTAYEVGQRVPVRYSMSRPSRAAIDTLVGMYGLTLIFFGSGLLFLLFGYVALRGFDRKEY